MIRSELNHLVRILGVQEQKLADDCICRKVVDLHCINTG